jgi:putative membrane protein
MWHRYMTQHMWGTGWLSMSLYMGIFWIVAIVAAVVIVGVLTRGGRSDTLRRIDDRALKALEERYARGEIGKMEFLEKRRDLQR